MKVKEGSITLRVGGTYTWYNDSGSAIKSTAYANLTAKTNGETVNWTLTMDDISSNKPFIYLYLKINGVELYDKYYNSTTSGASTKFPRGEGTSESGTVAIDADDDSIPIVLGVGPSIASSKFKKEDTLTRIFYTDVGTGTVSVADNGNNTFTVKGNGGAAGTNNPVKSATLIYTGTSTEVSCTTEQTITAKVPSTAGATHSVTATVTTKGTYGSNSEKSTTVSVKHYVNPKTAPGKPQISYSKSRLTIKEPWSFTWSAATKGNDSSPIKGYRIRLYKNLKDADITGDNKKDGSIRNYAKIKGLKVDSSGNLTKGTGTTDWVDYEGTTRKITLDPTDFGFMPGDTVRLGIYAYAVDKTYPGAATNNTNKTSKGMYWNGGGGGDNEVFSDKYTVQNAGIVRVKIGSSWKEGQVYVKTASGWKEAETVSVKTSSGWKESQ